ncbi:hypothetical protein [Cellulomonas sp. GbtcB1]|uniref:hypothetical protein n=1 Tax=Cellulomonas sp. GbtcB1 TaxID=2824746 RepID=UPI001C2F1DE8|nr:hypothetical protein [Cellulomonas sp. GbtcB1]
MTIENKKSRKKVWTAVGVAALAVAVAGGGALTTLYTSIAGNQFRTTVPDAAVDPEGALLQLEGQAIDHVFDSSTYNHQVRADWVLKNRGPDTTQFDGAFETLANVDQNLAQALVVQYGVVDPVSGDVTAWRAGGTVAAPTSFAAATGIDSIAGDAEIPVVVRVLLEDPTLIASDDDEEIGEVLRVVADFTVSYLDPLQPRA